MTIDEQALEDALGQDELNSEQEPVEPKTDNDESQDEQQEPVELTALQQEAQDMGHTSKDDFIANGGDPERWKTEHEYVSYGKIQARLDKQNAKLDSMSEKFEKRVDGLNKIHQQRLDAKIKSLQLDQRNAVEDSDTDRYDKAQQEIDDINVQKTDDNKDTVDQQTKDPAIVAWEAKNPWINDQNDPKAQMTAGLWNGYVKANPDASIQSALNYVDKQLESMNQPQHNSRRDNVTTIERGNQTNKPRGKITSIKSLSSEWQREWINTGHDLWGNDEKAFIQAVIDSETGA